MKVSFIGLGRMGNAMATRLLAAGHELTVYNRTSDKVEPLVALGARPAASIAEAAATGVVLTMLADDRALSAVCRSPGGLLGTLPQGGIHVAMGTHDVTAVTALAAAHAEAGHGFVAAPVLGRPDAVTAGRLAIIAGGQPSIIDRCGPLFEALGRRVFRAGSEPGAAAALKLANNFLLACAIEALGEAFSLVRKNGVDGSFFHEMVTDGLFASPAYITYSKIIADEAWDQVGFTVALGLKDVNLALAAGGAAGVPMPSANVCRDRLLGAIAHGDEQRDWATMALEQARASGLA
ncbi:MAG: NAD(P)-dependent oxidoreductase [Pseudomonadota bacterium]|nr:NAD(P)-dependent oxidoreductase [Pseudomonadota bacterium]